MCIYIYIYIHTFELKRSRDGDSASLAMKLSDNIASHAIHQLHPRPYFTYLHVDMLK